MLGQPGPPRFFLFLRYEGSTMTKRTLILPLLLLSAGAGCSKCYEPTDAEKAQEKVNADPAPLGKKGKFGRKEVDPDASFGGRGHLRDFLIDSGKPTFTDQ